MSAADRLKARTCVAPLAHRCRRPLDGRCCARVRRLTAVSCRLALQQQRAKGGTRLAERQTTNERLARRQKALKAFEEEEGDSGGVFLTAEDAQQVCQREPARAAAREVRAAS